MSKARIMIVEDERIVAEDLKEILQNQGYSVTSVARSGEMAIDMVEKDRPDLVLMDIVLKSKMDGIEAAQQIRSNFDIPVVYMTAYADEKTIERAKLTGPFGYIIKPFREKELQVNIEIGLYKHKLEKESNEIKERFHTTLKSIGDAVISVDKNSNVVFMNPAAQLLTGWNIIKAEGKKLNEVYRIVNGGGKKELIDKYGSKLPVEDKYTPITDNYGNVIGYVLVFRDTIDQKRIENELHVALKYWENIFNSISDCILILDMEGYILNTNGVFERLTGIETQNIIGKHYYKVTLCSSDFIEYDPIEKMKQNRMREYFEFEFMDKGGRLRFHATMDPIFDNSGDMINAILILRSV